MPVKPKTGTKAVVSANRSMKQGAALATATLSLLRIEEASGS